MDLLDEVLDVLATFYINICAVYISNSLSP